MRPSPATIPTRRHRCRSPGPVGSCTVLVSDLNHFLDLPDDVPGPARRLAEHFGTIVRAATAGDGAGNPWTSALPGTDHHCAARTARTDCVAVQCLR